MKKIVYIISDIDKALAFEWIATNLNNNKFDLGFILLNPNNSQLETFLRVHKVPIRRIKLYHGWKMIFTFFQLWYTLLRKRPQIIHTHLRYASLLGITAGYFSGIKSRIHTRHNSSFHNIYHPHAVKTDKLVSRLSTKIVSISNVVTDVLINWEHARASKIAKIPHGFDLKIFENIPESRINVLRKKYIPENANPVIGIISRYITWKGIEFGIEAFTMLLEKYPNAHLLLANAKGPDVIIIKEKLKTLPDGTYTEIVFEEDIASLYRLFDVFVHVPISEHFEAFGQTYIEALASGIPSVFTSSGIANEVMVHRENAWVVPFKDSKAIVEGLIEILSNDELRYKLSQRPLELLSEFALDKYILKLEDLYSGE